MLKLLVSCQCWFHWFIH